MPLRLVTSQTAQIQLHGYWAFQGVRGQEVVLGQPPEVREVNA